MRWYLLTAKEDCVILGSMPMHPMFSPQPRQQKYYMLLPINSDPSVDCSPIQILGAATLLTASRAGRSDGMATCVNLPPCFGSSKLPKTEFIEEPGLARGPL